MCIYTYIYIYIYYTHISLSLSLSIYIYIYCCTYVNDVKLRAYVSGDLPKGIELTVFRGSHLSNTSCLKPVLLKSDKRVCKWW